MSERFKRFEPHKVKPLILTANDKVGGDGTPLKVYIYSALLRKGSISPFILHDLVPSLWEAIERADVLDDGQSIQLKSSDVEDSPISFILSLPVYAAPESVRNVPRKDRPWPYGSSNEPSVRVFESVDAYRNRDTDTTKYTVVKAPDTDTVSHNTGLYLVSGIGIGAFAFWGLSKVLRN